ncbi:hypothetical protein GF1_27400 [Desulfolithobacter dissulfuricans]|uniref:Molybdenum cofactor carrier n=1 Tax=Desulfolithobacter dissulfuricans TaxID=2795293 RepID=A0A915U2X8_9BACT|nr:putative molybdenum carrier protein [Desulfolithobacter dissulfuricans]BCO10364.1 hypothetical protein GF1_27400 [Desulfolithobacter dissulfuricans]
MKIISGGQTGADRAALDAAIRLNIPHGGWLPRGRRTEEGSLPSRYRLQELPSANYRDRTRQNILDSDGTLIVSFGPLTGGSALTEALAIRHRRPCLHIDLELWQPERAKKAIEQWLRDHNIETLNVAGPRASGEPRIYRAVFDLLLQISWPETDETP